MASVEGPTTEATALHMDLSVINVAARTTGLGCENLDKDPQLTGLHHHTSKVATAGDPGERARLRRCQERHTTGYSN